MTLARGSIVVSAAEPAPIGVAVIDGATSASIAGTVVKVNVPQPAGHARYGKHE